MTAAYSTDFGTMYNGLVEQFLASEGPHRAGTVQLIMTSPPFPLNHKKRYGNKTGDEYVSWLSSLGPALADLLAEDGSLVIELGNAWEPGRPVMSVLALRALLALLDEADLNLCEQFIVHNPARLPTPAQWVKTTSSGRATRRTLSRRN
jgi:site-specific DNA-methyltransferase (cytosine-N4-specific)